MGAALLLKRITLIGLLWYILGDYHARVFSWIKRTDQPWSKTLFLMLLSIKAAELSHPPLPWCWGIHTIKKENSRLATRAKIIWVALKLFSTNGLCTFFSLCIKSFLKINMYTSFVKFMMKTWRFEELLYTTNSKITVNYSKQSCTFFLFAGGSKSDYSLSSFF